MNSGIPNEEVTIINYVEPDRELNLNMNQKFYD